MCISPLQAVMLAELFHLLWKTCTIYVCPIFKEIKIFGNTCKHLLYFHNCIYLRGREENKGDRSGQEREREKGEGSP